MQPRLIMCLALVLSLAGCGSPSADDLVKCSIQCWDEAADVLATITDAESAKAADPRLQDIVRRMKEFDRQARRQELSHAELWKVEKDNQAASAKALARVQELSRKVMDLPGCGEVVVRFNRQARGASER
ncbi:MAG: hypothetical protein L0Y72_25205 [Gemmataceae bacterium]|nr:hypothetical protein [Gemmataceae bacterium]